MKAAFYCRVDGQGFGFVLPEEADKLREFFAEHQDIGLPKSVAACGMFIVQDLINCVIPSGSGQAAVTMPLMVPLGDLLGINRQVNVLAFQFGDSLTNMVTPAGAKLMAGIAMCHIPYKKWMKFFLPCFILWVITACVLLIIATAINYGPF